MSIEIQKAQFKTVVLPQTVNTTALTGSIDTQGAAYATVMVTLQSAAATNVPTVIKLAERDSTSDSWTDITAAVGGGDGGFTLPTPGTAGENVVFHADMRGRKRYLQASVANTEARGVAVNAILTRKDLSAIDATTAGASVRVVL